ncbi:MAG: MFS transporter [Acidobacteria bacterium]|nr:MFS transporter [Acidobacteriota bacterium]
MAPGALYALVVLFLINLMNFFDRQIIGGVGEAIRREWGLNDTMLGALGTAFTLLYAFVGVPFGRLADKKVRKHILAGGVFAWSALTALSGAARNFSQLFIVRLGVGVGEATCSPAATSLIGDLFPQTMRARAMAVFMLGLPIGLGISSYVGALIAQAWGWRSAFFIAGIPGVLCALAALAIREPRRGMVEEHLVGTRQRTGSPYLLVLSIPTVWWVIASGALHNFNMYALGAFLSPFLIRFHHVSLSEAGLLVMFVFGFSGIVGLVGGGMAADALYRRRVDGRLLVATIAIVISTPLMYLALGQAEGDVWGFSLLMGGGIGIMYAYYSTVYATLQDVVEPALRGTAMALYFCAMYLLGASLGPLGTGVLSDYFTFKAAAAAGVATERGVPELLFDLLPTMVGRSKLGTTPVVEPFRAAGLQSAMYVIPLLSGALALVLFAASRTVKKDVEKLQAWMRAEVVR